MYKGLCDKDRIASLLVPAARVDILLALIRVRGEKMNPTDLYERAGINSTTWYRNHDVLLDAYGVIEKAGSADNSPLYHVDMEKLTVSQ